VKNFLIDGEKKPKLSAMGCGGATTARFRPDERALQRKTLFYRGKGDEVLDDHGGVWGRGGD